MGIDGNIATDCGDFDIINEAIVITLLPNANTAILIGVILDINQGFNRILF